MKNLLLMGGALLLASFQVHADTGNQSGTLYLAGVIPIVTTIQVDPLPGSDSLNLLASQSDLNVAQVTEENNTERGYYVTLQSKHGGNFEIQHDRWARRFNKIPFSAKYGGEPVILSRWPQLVYMSKRHNKQAQERSVNFSVSYEGQDPTTKLAGTYSDTLTFTITAR